MDIETFRAVVEAESRERAANPPAPAPDPFDAWGDEIERHPIGAPFAMGASLRRRLARHGVDAEATGPTVD
jgi:hypothetical protein